MNTQSTISETIEFVCEYRTRLVGDVVTGKLDVRAAAAKLPPWKPNPLPRWMKHRRKKRNSNPPRLTNEHSIFNGADNTFAVLK